MNPQKSLEGDIGYLFKCIKMESSEDIQRQGVKTNFIVNGFYGKYYLYVDMATLKKMNNIVKSKNAILLSKNGQTIKILQSHHFRAHSVNVPNIFFINMPEVDFSKILRANQEYVISEYYPGKDSCKRTLSRFISNFQNNRSQPSSQIINYIFGLPTAKVAQSLNLGHANYRNQLKDDQQIKAIEMAGSERVLMIEGPAGTGKTKTACIICKQLLKQGKKLLMATVTWYGGRSLAHNFILECNSQQQLADKHKFTQCLIEFTFMNDPSNLVSAELINEWQKVLKQRLLSQKIEKHFVYLLPLLTLTKFKQMQPEMRYYTLNTYLIRNIVQLDPNISLIKVIANLDKIAYKRLVPKQFRDLYKQAIQKTIRQADLILTITALAPLINSEQINNNQFFKPEVALIDEACQASLAQTLCCLYLDVKKLILVGDQKQINPYNTPKKDRKQILVRSIFNLVRQLSQKNLVTLKTDHRMNKKIGQLIYAMFYGGINFVLGNAEHIRQSESLGYRQSPVFMVTHNEQEQSVEDDQNPNRYYNLYEIAIIKMFIRQFPRDMLKSVGIISPYKDQVLRIRRAFEEEINQWQLDVDTIDGFQGGQKDYIFLSTVRSNCEGKIGALRDPNRINVSLSRATTAVIMVGDHQTLSYQESNIFDYNPWIFIIRYLLMHRQLFHLTDNQTNEIRNDILPKMREDQELMELDHMHFNFHNMEGEPETEQLPFIKANYR